MSQVNVDRIKSRAGTGSPTFTNGLICSGVGTFSSQVSIAGTLTYEDVTQIDSVGIVTARNGVDIVTGGLKVQAGVSTLTGWVSCGDTVALGDSKAIYFGADEDLAIYHDGSHSIIEESGTGGLKLVSNSSFQLRDTDKDTGDYCINANINGDVSLYSNGTKRIETSNTGAVVTGISTADDYYIGVGGTSVHTELGTKATMGKAIAMAMVFG